MRKGGKGSMPQEFVEETFNAVFVVSGSLVCLVRFLGKNRSGTNTGSIRFQTVAILP